MPIDAPCLWPPSFEGAIFDFDGTVAVTGHIWKMVDQVFLGSRGVEYTDEYARILSVLGFERGARYTIDTYGLSDTEEEVVAEWTRLSHALYRSDVTLRPGVRSYLLSLRKLGIRCALATSNEPELIYSMEHVDASELFDACVFGCEVGAPKDQPAIYLEAARRMGVSPERCIVFEDIEPGLLAAHGAEFATCAVWAEDPSQDWERVCDVADLSLTSWENLVN